jgi:hypothetical protein
MRSRTSKKYLRKKAAGVLFFNSHVVFAAFHANRQHYEGKYAIMETKIHNDTEENYYSR